MARKGSHGLKFYADPWKKQTTAESKQTERGMPLTADGNLYRIAQRYSVDGEEANISWVSSPRDGRPWMAIISGRPSQPVSKLVPMED